MYTCMASVQVIAPGEIESYEVAEALSTGAAVAVWGEVVPSPAKGQAFEVEDTHPNPTPNPKPN